MIYDLVENLKCYKGIAPEAVEALAAALGKLDKDSPTGKTVVIPDKLFILVQRYATGAVSEGKLEIHKNFADLQMLLSGNEFIGYAPVKESSCLVPYDGEGDYALYRAETDDLLLLALKPGNFSIFLPEEGHMPGRGDGQEVVKVVVKIHKSLLI